MAQYYGTQPERFVIFAELHWGKTDTSDETQGAKHNSDRPQDVQQSQEPMSAYLQAEQKELWHNQNRKRLAMWNAQAPHKTAIYSTTTSLVQTEGTTWAKAILVQAGCHAAGTLENVSS